LPSIGEWSTDRRRRLRNQVFLAGLEVEKKEKQRSVAVEVAQQKPTPGPCQDEMGGPLQPVALALCGAFSIYGVAMAALVFGGGWEQQGWVMLFASVLAVACLVVAGYLYGKRLLDSLKGEHRVAYKRLHEQDQLGVVLQKDHRTRIDAAHIP